MAYEAGTPEEEVEKTREFVSPRDLTKDRQVLQSDASDVLVYEHLLTLYDVESFTDEQKELFNKYEIVDLHTADGGILIRPKGVVDYGLDVTNDTVDVAGLTDEERLTDKGLEATMDAAIVARTLPNAGAGIYVYDNNPEVALVMKIAAEKAGLTVMNDDAIMNELTPELEAKVAEYERRLGEALVRIESGNRLGNDEPDPVPEVSEYETAVTVIDALGEPLTDTDPMERHVYEAVLAAADESQDLSMTDLKNEFAYEADPSQEALRTNVMLRDYAELGNTYFKENDVVATVDSIDAARRLLEERGIEDPDGQMAVGLAIYATRVAEISNEATEATPPEGRQEATDELPSAEPATALSVIEKVFDNPGNHPVDPALVEAGHEIGPVDPDAEFAKRLDEALDERVANVQRDGTIAAAKKGMELMEGGEEPSPESVEAAMSVIEKYLPELEGDIKMDAARGLAICATRVAEISNEATEATSPEGTPEVAPSQRFLLSPSVIAATGERVEARLAQMGLTPEDIDLDTPEKLKALAEHGLTLIDENGASTITGKPLDVEMAPEAMEEFKKSLEELGIEDPDGRLAQGLAVISTTYVTLAGIDSPGLETREEPTEPAEEVVAPTFDDFVKSQQLQYAEIDPEALAQNPDAAEHAMTVARYALNNIDKLDADSVALNNTIGVAVVAFAEQDPDDPSKGTVTYVAVHQTQGVYVYTEDVTVNPDGTTTSRMGEGQRFDMTTAQDRQAYDNIYRQFASPEAQEENSLLVSFNEKFERDLAVGGTAKTEGDVEFRRHGTRIGVASAADMNDKMAIEIENSYDPSGNNQFRLTVFRQNDIGGITLHAGIAEGVNDPDKYTAYDQKFREELGHSDTDPTKPPPQVIVHMP